MHHDRPNQHVAAALVLCASVALSAWDVLRIVMAFAGEELGTDMLPSGPTSAVVGPDTALPLPLTSWTCPHSPSSPRRPATAG